MRIKAKFHQLQQEKKKALITYITAGDPSIERTEELVLELEAAGADIIELGIPYSDPLADGPVLQAAAARALKGGTTLDSVLAMVERIRQQTQIPLAFLIYYNPVLQYGIERFVTRATAVGVDGVIIPDLPLEEGNELQEIIKELQLPLDLIPLVAPTSAKRVERIISQGSGFVYCVSTTGVTGGNQGFAANLEEFMTTVTKVTDLPTAIGFGISDVLAINQLKNYSDGLIIGSAIVKHIEAGNDVGEFVKTLRAAL